MNILITGSGGMVGTALTHTLKKRHDLILPKKHELNVSNLEQVISFKNKSPDAIVHLASETDHEYCDLNPTQCYFVNTIGTGFMVRLAKMLDIPIIYQSTASVFDGTKHSPYSTEDEPNPINHYNKSKYYAEIIARNYKKHIIIRSGWMFGGGEGIDKKFVAKIIDKIKAGQKRIRVCTDCIGSPTYSYDLADGYKYVIDNLIGTEDWGTYNCVNKSNGGVTRYDFAKEIVNILQADVEIVPCLIDDLKEEFPCKRTNYEVLEDGVGMPFWASSLKGYLYANYRH